MPKPAFGTSLDTSHALAPTAGCWLFNETSGTIATCLRANGNGTLSGSARFAGGVLLLGDAALGVNRGSSRVTVPRSITGNRSWFIRARRDITAGTSNPGFDTRVQSIVGTTQGGSTAGLEASLGNSFGPAPDVLKARASGRRLNEVNATLDLTPTVYVNGVLQTSANPVDTAAANGVWATYAVIVPNMTAGAGYQFGNLPNLDYPLTGAIDFIYEFDRLLSGVEVASLEADPFQMFASPLLLRRRRAA